MNRKEFFNQLAGKAAAWISETSVGKVLEVVSLVKERPPGAPQSDSKFQELCTGCDACMIACPVNVIMIDNLEKRFPVIYPEEAPCIHCTGYPCIQVCPTGALIVQNLP